MKKSLMKKNVVKKNLIRKVLLTILLFLPALLLAGCVGEEEKTMIDLRFDEGDSLALRQGWYLEDKSCLLYGDYVGAKGRQGRLYWLDKPGEEPVCIWPLAGGWFDLDDELLAYYLPEPQTVVLSNQTRQQFLLVDVTPGKTFATPQGNRQEIALPKVRARGDLDLCLWLGEGRYLLGRSVYGQEEEPLAVQLSHFDENTGADMPLAELPGRICDVKVDVERNRLLVLSNLGGLGVLDLSDMSKFHMLSCNCAEAWPTPSPFNEYLGVWPVQAADGDYLVLQSFCEDGIYYQIGDLNGGELGAYKSDAADGGLLAAYGHALYLAEYEPGEAVANTFAPAWNYTLLLYDFNRNACEPIVLGGGHTISLPQGNRDFPQRFGAASGVVKPDGEEMLWFCWEYVTQYRHFPDSLPLASR